jgi:hypothetical protein
VHEEDRRIDEMYKELYLGTGKNNPSLMTRMTLVELAIGDLRKKKWALIVATLAAIGDIVVGHLNVHFF